MTQLDLPEITDLQQYHCENIRSDTIVKVCETNVIRNFSNNYCFPVINTTNSTSNELFKFSIMPIL
jgi:hypothetical protein